jgi:S-layer homology domain
MNSRPLVVVLAFAAITGTFGNQASLADGQNRSVARPAALFATPASRPVGHIERLSHCQGAPLPPGMQPVKGNIIPRRKVARVVYDAFKSQLDRHVGPMPRTSPYSDVPVTDPDFRAIVVLSRHKIVAGDATGAFHPQDNVSRYELSMAMDRLVAELKPGGLQSAAVAMPKDIPSDVEAYSAVERMLSLGVVLPFTDGYFRGKRPTTDWEVANALIRVKALLKPERAPGRKANEQTTHTP